MKTIAENLAAVRARIDAACRRSGRDPARVRLVAVSKTKPAAAVEEALGAGQGLFGENRVMEARDKIPLVTTPEGGPEAEWHLIGPLQRNKVKVAVRLFSMIHGVDSPALAEEIAKRAVTPRPMPVLLQINLADESQKHGVPPGEAAGLLRAMAAMEGITVKGLMAIPPRVDTPEAARPYFRRLAGLAAELRALDPSGLPLPELSMGMSGDFEVAVEEGATLVRVGSALFGPRPPAGTAAADK